MHCGRQLRRLARQFILDRKVLPINPYGNWNQSVLLDESLVNEVQIYLLSIGTEISGQKMMDFLNSEDVRSRHGIEKPIKLRTAQRYLNAIGYRYKAAPKGQYADGHERDDVVFYREQIFLPQWRRVSDRMANWADGELEYGPPIRGRRVIAWFHDESIFYANDRRKKGWFHKDAPAKPYAKGEGASLMIADFVSADFGWLRSPDGKRSARRVMKPGEKRDGYFSNDDIIKQAEEAMAILKEFYPEYDHILIYDNATTHLKRADGALSARHMPKNTPKPGHNWATGKPERETIKMQPQSLYFPDGHTYAGVFKGMATILEELRAECKAETCCCRRILFNQPDFASVESVLETTCRALGFELNFIEQCWGYAKCIYQDHLERNALAALAGVPLASMRKFAICSRRFMDAYERAWAARKYKGHRVLPMGIV
ncbi:hypothetical protein BDZ97DRAFT_1906501 [Flammula alnicola]|nr:hypothetical protein BDZ97DRAFT_1906501 [Flammula alnicola]